MDRGLLGQIVTPATGNRLKPGRAWCADNAAFSGRYPGDDAYLAWLAARLPSVGDCAVAVAPDIPLDAAATLALSAPMLPRIRALSYPVALCAQDGLEQLDVPWRDFDVLFIAGSTQWKLSAAAAALARDRADAEGWRGEAEGIDLTLTFQRHKRDGARRLSRREPINLGLPRVGGGG